MINRKVKIIRGCLGTFQSSVRLQYTQVNQPKVKIIRNPEMLRGLRRIEVETVGPPRVMSPTPHPHQIASGSPDALMIL
jgi:hypothetical protein